MNEQSDAPTAYAFFLDAVWKGNAYYRTVSLFSGSFGNHGRDQRQAHPVIIANFERIMSLLKLPVRWLRTDDDLTQWLAQYGWALVPGDYAERRLGSLLGSRQCVKSAIGLFWDVALPRCRANGRRIPKKVRQQVLKRDAHRCLECGRSEKDGVTLTMDHVIPYSRGGETTEGNLVTLCQPCNQKHGSADHRHLFTLAGLHHDWDPGLLDAAVAPDPAAKTFAALLSQNIMVSCCKVDFLPQSKRINQGSS